jgi:hypothetical protein
VTHLEGHGVSIDLPPGWEGRVRRDDLPSSVALARLHAGNFALPVDTADYGGGAVERMRGGHLFVALLEFERASAGTPLFADAGVPQLDTSDFSPMRLQRIIPGQSGAQRFFTAAGRPFCLYVVLGSHLQRVRTVPHLRHVLSTLRIA